MAAKPMRRGATRKKKARTRRQPVLEKSELAEQQKRRLKLSEGRGIIGTRPPRYGW